MEKRELCAQLSEVSRIKNNSDPAWVGTSNTFTGYYWVNISNA